MTPQLELTDYQSETRWRWVLYDERRNLLADHDVALDPADPQYQDFLDVPGRLDYHAPLEYGDGYAASLERRRQWMHALGEWAGEKILGGLRPALKKHLRPPVTVV